MVEKVSKETLNEATEPHGQNPEEKIQEEIKSEETKADSVNWLKCRLEREREKGSKQILNELGVTSADEIKDLYKKLEEMTANYEKSQEMASKAKSAEQKLEILKNGFDEKFVDFIVHELGKSEDFASGLNKFKIDNPQYLKALNSGIKISTSPNFEKKYEINDFSKQFNEAILEKLYRK